MPSLMCKQSAVGQWLQHFYCYSTCKHALGDEKGANRDRGMKTHHKQSVTGISHICRGRGVRTRRNLSQSEAVCIVTVILTACQNNPTFKKKKKSYLLSC